MKILEDIKRTEQSSEKRLEAASQRKDELIAKAHKDALALTQETQQSLEQDRKDKIARRQEELSIERKATEKAAAKELDRIEKKFSANKDKAVALLLGTFEESLNA